MSETIELARALISRASITPDDAGCLDLIAARLEPLGFECERMRFGEVDNLWARRGTDAPVLALAGHVDVVPPGPLTDWRTPPFEPVIEDGWLHGRGAADMKGGLAGLVTAAERFVRAHPGHAGTLAFLLTADEEGPSVDGTRRVVETLGARGVKLDWCLLGEPSSHERAGDTLRNGRRGSLNARLTVRGIQGHVAFMDPADNPVHRLAPVLAELCAIELDAGNAYFPPSHLQVSNIEAGTGADNVTPGTATVAFNIRYSTEQTADALERRIAALLDGHGLDYAIEWRASGDPFLSPGGPLLAAAREALAGVLDIEPVVDTGGGTSDGRYIAPGGTEVIELGPVNATIHQVNELVRVDELDELSAVYERIITRLLA